MLISCHESPQVNEPGILVMRHRSELSRLDGFSQPGGPLTPVVMMFPLKEPGLVWESFEQGLS